MKLKSAPIAVSKDTEQAIVPSETNIDYIYCLYETISKTKFYIGRTEDPKRRLREHRYGARTYKDGDELKYLYAKALDDSKIKWGLEVLMECGPDTEFYEDYFVNLYRHEPLQNMRAGDSEPWMGRNYPDPKTFVKKRAELILAAKNKIQTPKIKKQSDVTLTRFVDDIKKDSISPALQEIMARRNKRKI